MHRSRIRIPAVLVVLAVLPPAALGQTSRPLNAKELEPVIAAARGWLEARDAGRDPAQERAALELALEQGRKAAGGGHAMRWSSDLGQALRNARSAPRSEERPGNVVELESRGASSRAARSLGPTACRASTTRRRAPIPSS